MENQIKTELEEIAPIKGDVRELVKKLAKIQSEVGAIEKERVTGGLKYAFHSEASFMAHLSNRIADANIFICTSVISSRYMPQEGITRVKTSHTIICGDTGATITVLSEGHGKSVEGKDGYVGDKGIYKAITGAMKYFLGKNFMISDRQDPEYDQSDGTQQSTAKSAAPANNAIQTNTPSAGNNSTTNNNGYKPRDPSSYIHPEQWLGIMTMQANKPRTQTEEQQKKMAQTAAIALNKLCLGNKPRMDSLKQFLIGGKSFTEISFAECWAVVKWINVNPLTGDPDPLAAEEADDYIVFIAEQNARSAERVSDFEKALMSPDGLAAEPQVEQPAQTPLRFARKQRE